MSSRPLDSRVLRAISEVDPSAWNALALGTSTDPAEAVPVLRWEWLEALESSGSASRRTGWEPHHLTVWRDGRLVGAAPAWRKHHSMGEYIYDFGWAHAAQAAGIAYYPKLLVGVPLSPLTAPRLLVAPDEAVGEVRRALLALAVESARDSDCSSVHLLFSPEEEAAAIEATGLGFVRRWSLQYHWRNVGYRSYDEFLSRFDAKRRHQLKRERRAATEQGLELVTVRGEELASARRKYAQLAFHFYESTCHKHAWGQVQLNADFFTRAFAALPESMELVLARHAVGPRRGEVVAGAFNLLTKRRRYGRYWGCFEEHPFLHFNVCLYQSIAACIDEGREAFEPGAGGEHKIARGFEPTAIHSTHLLFDPRLAHGVAAFVERERREVEEILARAEETTGMRPWKGR